MTFEIAFVLGVILLAVILFTTEKLSIDLTALMVMAVLVVSGIITIEEGISGFSSSATITVGAMFIISAALFKTGAVSSIGKFSARMFKHNFWIAIIAMMAAAGVISAFINNTPVVAVFIPILLGVARDNNISPSKLLMPLSFASMFGGVCTLIGTSTNILVSAIAVEHNQPAFGMFEFTLLGLIFFAIGLIYMSLAGIRFIPNRRSEKNLTETFGMGDYLTEIVLLPNAKSVGTKVIDSPLVKELDIDILEVIRGDNRVVIPTGQTYLLANDTLRVRCDVKKIQLLKEREGIVLKPHVKLRDKDLQSEDTILVEAVIAPNSLLIGKTLKSENFRNTFNATVLAIRHRGELMHQKLGSTILTAGDALLIEVRAPSFEQLKSNNAFVFVSEIGLPRFRKSKMKLAILIIAGVIITATINIFPIVMSAVIGSILLILSGCVKLEEAYQSIEWKVIFLLAGALSMGLALEKSGAALFLSNIIITGLGYLGPVAILSAFYLLTTLLTETMSNNATAILLAPIAISAASALGLDPRPFLITVMFAASASFMTPVGYQTNTMIYGVGLYKFSDFFKIGAPLNLIFWLLATLLIPVFFPFVPVK